jgi:hypothetical protein
LVDALDDPDAQVSYQAILALDRIGPEAASAVPALNEVARGKGANRIYAVRAIWHLEHRAAAVLPLLVAGLRDTHGFTCEQSLDVLDELGDDARPAIPALVEVRRRYSFGEGVHAYDILHRLDPDADATVKNWHVFTSNGGEFSVLQPVSPEESHDSFDTRAGRVSERRYTFRFRPHDYTVMCYSGWPVDVPSSATPEQGLDALVLTEKAKGRLGEARRIRPAGKYPGREVVVEVGGQMPRAYVKRYYWVKHRLYVMYASANDGEARRFMDSFRLLDR